VHLPDLPPTGRPYHIARGPRHEAGPCCKVGRVSFADALVWAAARSDSAAVYSLDARFPEDGVTVLREAGGASTP
jgi:hypothetical protein